MYQLWRTAKALAIRPSDLLAIEQDDLLRFEIDQAVSGLGMYVDNKLEEVDKNLKRKYPTPAAVFATVRTSNTVIRPITKTNITNPPTFRRRLT